MTSRCQFRLALLNAVVLATQPAAAANFGEFAPPRTATTPELTLHAPSTWAAGSTRDEEPAQSSGGALPLEAPIDPEQYICGSGDGFQLNTWGRQNASFPIVVDPMGRAFVPKIGYVQVAGQTLKDAIAALRSAVSHFYPRLSFDFSLATPRTFLVHVVGAVRTPGTYAAHATDRLIKVLERAGTQRESEQLGGQGTASIRRIEVAHRNGNKATIDLLRYKLYGETNHNPFLQDGDVIVVPFESLIATISGAVQRPGQYELVGSKDVTELVEVAGGLRGTATRQLPLLVSKRDPSSDRRTQMRVQYAADGNLPAIPVQNGDYVHIPSVEELQRSVMLVGAIQGASQTDEATSTKRLTYEQGDTVRTLIERAGGLGAGADYKGSYIVRMRNKEKSIIPLDLEALLIYRDMKADQAVRIGDVINIPYQRHSIMVEGSVLRPGVYQFNPRLHVIDYVALAGGPSKMAQDVDSYRIVTPQGKVGTVDNTKEVQPGDTLIVPERHFSRAEITQIIISAVGLAIMTTTVALTAYTVAK